MTDADDDTRARDRLDGVERPVELWRQRHHPQRVAARGEETAHVTGRRGTQQGGFVRTTEVPGEPRSLEVQPREDAVLDEFAQGQDRALELTDLVGDEARDEARRAVRQMGVGDPPRLASFTGGEGGPAAAVAVGVDEAGRECAREVPLRGCRGTPFAQLGDARALDTDPPRGEGAPRGEDPVGGEDHASSTVTIDSSPSRSRPGVRRFH